MVLLSKRFVIWALFDSGNGSYFKDLEKRSDVEFFSIGIDRENKNSHFINLDLSSYTDIFGDSSMFDALDKLPKPDLIIASPPCESWSNASAMANGNACWKQDMMENLFGEMKGSRFSVREYDDFDGYQFKPYNQIMTRINGELTIFNTIRIIKKFEPKYYIIENPAFDRIWEYIDKVLGFDIEFENLTYYSNYGYSIPKPTKFGSNVYLNLNDKRTLTGENMNNMGGYNQRSNIPAPLVEHIFDAILKKKKEKENENKERIKQ